MTEVPLPWCRYLPGQRFGRHIDESVELGQGQKTRYTLLIYLSGSDGPGSTKGAAASNKPAGRLQGGATVFYGEPCSTALPMKSQSRQLYNLSPAQSLAGVLPPSMIYRSVGSLC